MKSVFQFKRRKIQGARGICSPETNVLASVHALGTLNSEMFLVNAHTVL
jgi:hypothetical protein